MPRISSLPAIATALLAAAAAAQSVPTAPAAAGADATQPPLAYRSPLEAYQPFTDEQVSPWKQANDTVGRIGGWREYARESRQPAAAGATPGGSGTSAPHGEHEKH